MAGISQGRSVSTIAGEGYSWDSVSLDAPGVSLGGGFSPQDLFFYGEQGAWYDPSDLSTMFQDRVGTTQVTADGQTVGLILDKSKGLVLGPELVTNGDFSNGITGWNVVSGDAAVVAGELVLSETSGNVIVTQALTSPSSWFKISLDVSVVGGADADVRVYIGGNIVLRPTNVTKKRFTCYGFASANPVFQLSSVRGNVTYSATFDNISVEAIAGNHAVAPSDAARPLYKTDGTYHWLQFDGVDDVLSTEVFTMAQPETVSIGFTQVSSTYNDYLLDGKINDRMVVYQETLSPNMALYSSPTASTQFGGPSIGNSGVGTFIFRGSSSKARINGVDVWSGSLGTGNSDGVTIGCSAAGPGKSQINFYSIIVRGALSTTDEITNTETWVNSKTGAF